MTTEDTPDLVALVHASDCDLHNAPAEPVGPCSCGADKQDNLTMCAREALVITNALPTLASQDTKSLWISRAMTLLPILAREYLRAVEALTKIANDPHCSYDSCENGQYGIGVVDGHRCAATKARAALKSCSPPQARG
jgi:hypothetical protein